MSARTMTMGEIFKIDTKGTCLVCLNDCANDGLPDSSTSTAFKMLLRYLKIDIMKLDHFSSLSSFLNCPDSVDICVSLCHRCSSMTNQFHRLFQDFEKIRIELDYYAGKLYQTIEEGEKFANCVREYGQRMKGPVRVMDALHASIAEKLRKTTLEKCARRLKTSSPRILLKDVLSSTPTTIGKVPSKQNTLPKTRNQMYTSPTPRLATSVDIDMPLLLHHDPLEVSSIENDHDENTSSPALELDPHEEEDDDNIPKKISRPLFRVEGGDLPRDMNLNWVKLDQGSFRCRLCGDIFDNNSSFRKHYMNLHKKSCFKCAHCENVYPRKATLTEHVSAAHALLQFSDQLLPNTSDEELRRAVRSLTDQWEEVARKENPDKSRSNTSYRPDGICRLCEKKCRHKFHLRGHIFQSHMDKVNDAINQMRTIIKREESERALLESLGGANSSLLQMGHHFLYQNPDSIEENKTTPPPPPENIEMDCDEPSSTLQLHLQEDSDEEDESLAIVPANDPLALSDLDEATEESTSSFSNLRTPNALNGFECSKCEKVLRSKQTLRTHQQEFHSGVKLSFPCHLCKITYTRKAALEVHQMIEHAFEMVNGKLPPGTAEPEFRTEVDKLLAQARKIIAPAQNEGVTRFECEICRKPMSQDVERCRAHIIRFHLDQIVSNITKEKGRAVQNEEMCLGI